MDKMRCIVLYANPYSMVSEEDGKVLEGISTVYLPADNLSPVIDEAAGTKGINFGKLSLPLDMGSKIVNVPGLYDVTFKMRMVKNKPTLTFDDLEYLSDISISYLNE